MKQVININFHGQVVPIEVSAFDILKGYTDSLARFFANEEGKEEIINDIESRIAELFQERLKKGATCITDEDVNAIIKSMGRPEEFDGEEEKVASTLGERAESANSGNFNTGNTNGKRLYRDENNKVLGGVCGGLANYFGTDPMIIRIIFVLVALFFGTGILAYIILWVAVPSTSSTEIGGVRKKLFRDPDDKIIAGVCSGIGNYFGITPWIPRVLFLLPFLSIVFRFGNWGISDFGDFFNFSFSPGSLIVYIVLWLVFPEAGTTAEKLEMKGEKVDMNSIKNSVMEEMKGVQKRAEKFGQEAKTFAEEKGQQMGAELKTVAKRSSRSLGDIIVLLVKIFAYIVIGCVSVFFVGLLFATAIGSTVVFPYKGYLLADGWQDLLAWGTLLFFIAVPVIGVITWIIRRLAKMKGNRKVLRASFISLWILGWICVMFLIALVFRDFRTGNRIVEEEITLINPTVNKLEITTDYPHRSRYYNGWVRVDDDTAYIRNIGIVIEKSTNDSFRVTIKKLARGNHKSYADTTARLINFKASQFDSMLVIDREIAFSKNTKFRNQGVLVTIYVPVGKQIRLDQSTGRFERVHFGWDDEDEFSSYNDDQRLEKNVDYIMKADGLYTLDGMPVDEEAREKLQRIKIEKEGIEIESNGNRIKVDENGVKMQTEGGDNYRYERTPADKIDSLKIRLENEKVRVKDSLQKIIEDSKKQLEKIEDKKVVAQEANEGPGVLSSYQMPLLIHIANLD